MDATDANSHVAEKKEGGPLKEGGGSLTPAFTPPVLRPAVPDYREEEYPGCGLISAHTFILTYAVYEIFIAIQRKFSGRQFDAREPPDDTRAHRMRL
jgi:hypothetical protein